MTVRRAASVLLTVLIVASVGWALGQLPWDEVVNALSWGTVRYAALAAVVNVAALGLTLVAWRGCLGALGAGLDWPTSARVYLVGVLAKYVPGRVWVAVAQAREAAGSGVDATHIGATYLLNICVVLLSGAVVGLGAAAAALGDRAFWLAVPAAAFLAALRWPRILTGPCAWAARRIGRPLSIQQPERVRPALLVQSAAWLVSGAHAWLLCVAVADVGPADLLFVACGFTLATTLGTLVVIVPDGAVVREAVFTAILATTMPWSAAVAVSVLSRVVCTVSEVLLAGGVLVVARGRERRSARSLAAGEVS